MNRKVIQICEAIRDAGGRGLLVGGSVRDRLCGIEPKDFDIEAFGLEPAKLREVLDQIGRVDTVGEHFAVYKLAFNDKQSTSEAPRFEIDVSLPRRESKSGRGHRAFVIEGDPRMSFGEAARRRDFTINAVLLDPLTGELIDPYRGADDLRDHILRAVAADTFVDDSLRVLRAVQLTARFELLIAPDTVNLCRSIDLSDLPRERVWGEIVKLLTLAQRPSIGISAAVDLLVIEKLLPELQCLIDCGQVLATGRALDEAVKLAGGISPPRRIALLLSTLCGLLDNSAEKESQTQQAPASTLSLMKRLGVQTMAGYDVFDSVASILKERNTPERLYERDGGTSDGDIRRLSSRVEIDLLYRFTKAWSVAAGASTAPADWLIEHAGRLNVINEPPAPLLLGRHLIEAGFAPGPVIGRLLRLVYERQLDGEVSTMEEARAAALLLAKEQDSAPQTIPVDTQ